MAFRPFNYLLSLPPVGFLLHRCKLKHWINVSVRWLKMEKTNMSETGHKMRVCCQSGGMRRGEDEVGLVGRAGEK